MLKCSVVQSCHREELSNGSSVGAGLSRGDAPGSHRSWPRIVGAESRVMMILERRHKLVDSICSDCNWSLVITQNFVGSQNLLKQKVADEGRSFSINLAFSRPNCDLLLDEYSQLFSQKMKAMVQKLSLQLKIASFEKHARPRPGVSDGKKLSQTSL